VSRIHTNASLFFQERGVRPTPHSLPVFEIDDSDRRLLLVAHAGTNSVLICHLLGLPATPWEWERFVLGHASISRLVSYQMGDGHTFGLVKLSDVEHLDRGDRTF
jgi:probable phosphoglycerate mutase